MATILADLELDKETIVSGLLHDVVEDTDVTIEEITKDFGNEVSLLVDGVTKINKLNFSGDNEAILANHRKILVGLTEDVEKDAVYMGKVTKLMPAFAIVEVLPNKEGLLHISQISKERIAKIEDKLAIGQEIMVKVIEVDKVFPNKTNVEFVEIINENKIIKYK